MSAAIASATARATTIGCCRACRTRSRSRSHTIPAARGDAEHARRCRARLRGHRPAGARRGPGPGLRAGDKRRGSFTLAACSPIRSRTSSSRCRRARRLRLQGQRGRVPVRRQGREPEEPRAQLLPGQHQRLALLHRAPAARDRRPRDFVAQTEKEAALLENSLIKEHQPRYNVKLRDDKEFLSLRLDPNGAWPRLEVVRRPKRDGARYFGPYHSATSARSTLRPVNRHFRLRTCTDTDFARACGRACSTRSSAARRPCVYEVDRDEYAEQVRGVGLFLEGRHDELSRICDARMQRRRRRAGVRAGRDVPRSAPRGRSAQQDAARLGGARHRSGRVRVLPRRPTRPSSRCSWCAAGA